MTQKKRVFTVLCIDGGGVRGLIPARILEEIEKKTGKRIFEMFDLIGGPSTGSIIATGLTAPDPHDPTRARYTATDIKNFYHRETPKIFPGGRFKGLRQISRGFVYDPRPLENAFKRALGDTKMNEALTSLMVPATDIKEFRPVWMNYIKGEKDTSPEKWSTMMMRDVVRASTTAPTYFPVRDYTTQPNKHIPQITHRHTLIDGGFFAGNTLHRLMAQARKMAPPDADIVFVHLGTGSNDNSLSADEFNKLGPLGLFSKAKGSVLMSLIVNLGVQDAANHLREEMGDNYVQFDGKMPMDEGPMSLDDASPRNLARLEKFAEKILKNNASDFDRICALLAEKTDRDASFEIAQEAFERLADTLRAQKTLRMLKAAYQHMTAADDASCAADVALLRDTHKEQLAVLFKAQQEKLAQGSKLSSLFRDATEDIKSFFRRAAKKPAPPPANDDRADKPDTPSQPPAAAVKGKKRRRDNGRGNNNRAA